MRSAIVAIGLAMAVLLMQAGPSQAVEVDFSTIGVPGNLGTTSYTDPGTGLRVYGYYFDGLAWASANLYLRSVDHDHGFGVCNPIEAAANGGDCPGPLGGGDVNELDNGGESELIVLQLPPGYRWVSVQVSSMDANTIPPDRGILYADGDGNLSTTFGNVGDTQLETFTGGVDPIEAIFNIDPFYAEAPYLVFEPFDHTGGSATDNDYLVYKATIVRAGGGQGCTPGYWKQEQHFDSWVGYSPADSYDTVFGVTSSFGSTFTLLNALKQGGGGEKALGRHAVAALLDSANPDVSYEFSTAEVIQIVQDAYASGDFETAKNQLAAQNEQGCPLN